jgi:hypothetical protein
MMTAPGSVSTANVESSNTVQPDCYPRTMCPCGDNTPRTARDGGARAACSKSRLPRGAHIVLACRPRPTRTFNGH